MPQRDRPIDEDALPVMVPRSDRILAPTSPERIGRLRDRVARIVGAMRNPVAVAPVRAEPDGFAADVVRTACTLCRGWCCANGADDGFLDERTLARVRGDGPVSDDDALIQLFVARVPAEGYKGSCIFHGRQGCTLDRSMRSDVCNSYFCGGLHGYLAAGTGAVPTVVIAGEGRNMRTSPVLVSRAATPRRGDNTDG